MGKHRKQWEDGVSMLRKRVALMMVGCIGLMGCSSDGGQPEDPVNNGFPNIGSMPNQGAMQCRSQIVRQEGNTTIYLNTYFTVDSSGTETQVSQAEGSTSCP